MRSGSGSRQSKARRRGYVLNKNRWGQLFVHQRFYFAVRKRFRRFRGIRVIFGAHQHPAGRLARAILPKFRRFRVFDENLNIFCKQDVQMQKTGSLLNRGLRFWMIFAKNAYLLSPSATATAQATVAPTIGLLPMPMRPIISTCAGTDEEPANCASPCIRPMESVRP